MKIGKRLVGLLLMMALLLGNFPVVSYAAESGTCGDNLTWTLDANGILTISGTGEMTDYTISANAPWNQYAALITAIVIEDGVTSVGDRAFRNFQNCTSVTLPDTLTDFGMGSFYGMDHLPAITIPSGITAIQDGAFSGCDALTEIIIPQGVTSLGMNSFSFCEGLKTVNIPTSVTTISPEAFYGCYVLEDVFYAGNTAAWENISIGNYNDPLLNANIHCVEATGNCGYSGKNLVWTFYSDGLLKITGSGSMKDYTAGYNSPFYNYKDRINRVILPEGIETIGKYAFQGGYPNLPYIEIPMSVGYIRKNSFGVGYDNVKLKYPGTMAQWKAINHSEYAYDRYFGAECADGTILYMGNCGTSASYDVMGDGTLKITGTGTMTFYQHLQQSSYWSSNDAITRVEIDEGITNIAAYAFKNCTNLQSIVIPASVVTISGYVFYNCDALTDVYYGGNERGWDSMNIYSQYNDPLFSATIHYTDLCKDGHDLQSHEAQAPTCQESGWEAYEDCSRCYYTTYVEIPAGDHVYKTAVTEPTCTAEGYTTYTCDCGDTYTGDTVAALGHSHEAVITPPTCEENGYTTYTCIVCGDSYTGDETPADGHAYSTVVTDPTCTDGGYTTNICNCGETYIDEEVAALGHNFGAWIEQKKPSVSEEGLEVRTCDRCGDEETRVIAKLDNPFTDVPAGSWYFEPVMWAVDNGVTTGATATTFNPNGNCLRAHVVTFLHRAAGSPEPTMSLNPFADVKSGDFYYKPVLWAVQMGITNGTSATTFGTLDNCNRAAVVTFLWRAKGCPEPKSTNNPFVDVPTDAFYYKAVLWAVENGITNGVDATHFGPTAICNRAQVVTFLYRAYK